MAAGDLCTLDQVKAWLKITTTDDDVLLAGLIADASSFIPNVIQRGVLPAVYTETYKGNGKDRMLLRNNPIISVTSVQWQGTLLTTTADPFSGTSGFFVDDKSICLVGYTFPLGQPVQVVYQAGFSTVPGAIVQACIELVGERYRGRTHIGETSHAAGGNTTVSFDTRAMNAFITARLANYTRVAPV